MTDMKDILLASALFWIFYILDWYKTKKGILPDASNEGNPITRYLFRKIPKWLHDSLNLFYGAAVTIVILFGEKLGLWIGYSAVMYNIIGFVSWTRLNKWKEITNRTNWTSLILIGACTLGYLLLLLHELVWTQ